MAESIGKRFKSAWNAFRAEEKPREEKIVEETYDGYATSTRPDRTRYRPSNEGTIINSLYTRIAIDVSSIPLRHSKVDKNGNYLETQDSKLQYIFDVEANLDQTGRALIQDLVMTMFDEGVAAVVPVDTMGDPYIGDSYDILTMRVGRIVQWYPSKVRVSLYNEKKGIREEVTVPKHMVAIIENPLYAVMNQPNSILKRLIRKLSILDQVDEQSGSGKLDLIMQLPYAIKGETKKEMADKRRADLELQLKDSKYGIGYIDATEKITQLNRPVENNLLKTIEYLTTTLYSQLGLTTAVFDGTADEKVMLNYFSRTVEPILNAIVGEFRRKFLSKNALTRGQDITFHRDVFKLVPVSTLAELADKFTRNAILSSNEVRGIIGYVASEEPEADTLRNKNLNLDQNVAPGEEMIPEDGEEYIEEEEVDA